MANPFTLNISGLGELKDKINKLEKNVQEGVIEEMERSAANIDNAAKTRVPVDTGFLKNSINWKTVRQIKGVEIVANKDYAAYVEFGTATLVSVPQGLEAYAIQFKGKGKRKVNLPARPFMFNSYFEEKPKLIERIVKKIENK